MKLRFCPAFPVPLFYSTELNWIWILVAIIFENEYDKKSFWACLWSPIVDRSSLALTVSVSDPHSMRNYSNNGIKFPSSPFLDEIIPVNLLSCDCESLVSPRQSFPAEGNASYFGYLRGWKRDSPNQVLTRARQWWRLVRPVDHRRI